MFAHIFSSFAGHKPQKHIEKLVKNGHEHLQQKSSDRHAAFDLPITLSAPGVDAQPPAGRASRPARLRFQPGDPRAGKSARRAHALGVRDVWPGCECRGLAPRRLRARRRRRSPFWGRKWRAAAALGGLWRARGQAHAPGTRRAGPGRWFRAACAGVGRARARTRAPRPPQAATGATLGGLLGRFREGMI